MAQLTPAEFADAVAVLAEHHGIERLRDKLARLGAFTSRRGLNTAAAIADRLHLLSGGLRRQVPATYAFSHLWTEMVGQRLGEEGEKKLETLADDVNACLDGQEQVAAGREADLDRALGAYREALAAATSARIAETDMLLKSVPAVAERLRRPAPASPEPPTD